MMLLLVDGTIAAYSTKNLSGPSNPTSMLPSIKREQLRPSTDRAKHEEVVVVLEKFSVPFSGKILVSLSLLYILFSSFHTIIYWVISIPIHCILYCVATISYEYLQHRNMLLLYKFIYNKDVFAILNWFTIKWTICGAQRWWVMVGIFFPLSYKRKLITVVHVYIVLPCPRNFCSYISTFQFFF